MGNVSLDVLITNGTDCNGNGVSDEEDIANGTSEDCNNSTIPDEREADPITDCDGNAYSIPAKTSPTVMVTVSPTVVRLPEVADCDANGILTAVSLVARIQPGWRPLTLLLGRYPSQCTHRAGEWLPDSMAIDLTYTNVDADGSWAGDLLIQITDPQGTCVEVGGFDVDLCEIDDFLPSGMWLFGATIPTPWTSAALH